LFNSGVKNKKINVKYGDVGVADGHHRFKSIKLLGERGLLKEVYVPVQLIPAHDTEVVRIGTLSQEEQPLSIQEIERCFKEPTKVIPLCTSHFQTKLADGDWQRLQFSQPDLVGKRDDLIEDKR